MTRDPVDILVGQRLRQLRRDGGHTLEAVGEALGVSYQQVQKYEGAANRVSASQLWRLAAFLNTDVDSFFLNTGHPTADLDLMAKLERLPPNIRPMIGLLAEAIVAAEKRASGLSDLPPTDPS